MMSVPWPSIFVQLTHIKSYNSDLEIRSIVGIVHASHNEARIAFSSTNPVNLSNLEIGTLYC